MADAETTWVLRRFARRPSSPDEADHATGIEGAIDRYRRVWSAVDDVVAQAATLDRACPDFDGEAGVNLRWILTHLLEETARHAGHADIIREIVDGTTGR
jgi:hypothetical protein